MPSTYAHYRMGQEVRACVGKREKDIIEAYPELFLIGLHGPDILFYYRPLQSNSVNRIGYGMHERPGREFFENAGKTIREHGREDAYLSYVYGFICHFALDVTCHGYIDEKIAASGISHAEIEVEFDRELMVMDGLDPIRQKLTNHIVPSAENAEVIHAFFQGTGSKQIQKALKGMILNSRLLLAPTRPKRFLISTFLKLSGHYESMHGLVVNLEKNPECGDSTEKLLTLYQEAKRLAIRLIQEYQANLDGERPLDPVYNYTFDSKLIENEVKKDEDQAD
ncbi:MAG: zinc dependent phospholipase C family protein [Lachnospiraceae bacterium]